MSTGLLFLSPSAFNSTEFARTHTYVLITTACFSFALTCASCRVRLRIVNSARIYLQLRPRHTEYGTGHGTGSGPAEMNRSCTIPMGLFTPNTYRAVLTGTAPGPVFMRSVLERFDTVWSTAVSAFDQSPSSILMTDVTNFGSAAQLTQRV